VAWHGRAEDEPHLVASVLAHCECQSANGRPCAAHQLLADQHALDHLAFARSVRQRLLVEETLSGASGSRAEKAEWSALLARCRATSLPRRPATATPGMGAARAIVLSLLALALILGGLTGPRHQLAQRPAPAANSSSR